VQVSLGRKGEAMNEPLSSKKLDIQEILGEAYTLLVYAQPDPELIDADEWTERADAWEENFAPSKIKEFFNVSSSAHEPPAKPVAWRGVLDSAYELHPRYVYSDSQPERGEWEPLYAAPPASAPPPGVVTLDRIREVLVSTLDGYPHTVNSIMEELEDG
jgi:hypothetical protein